jgi:hypothetical protein
MKVSIKAFAILAIMAIVAVGCGKVEKILPKKDGLWVGTSAHVVSYLNDTLFSDTTLTDSLGEIFFDKDGTGYTADNGGANQSPFTWSVNDDNDQLTIVDSSGTATTSDILEVEKNEMTLFSSVTSGTSPFVFRTEVTSVIQRKE